MSKSKKLWLILLATAAVALCLREAGVLNLNWYSSNEEMHMLPTWHTWKCRMPTKVVLVHDGRQLGIKEVGNAKSGLITHLTWVKTEPGTCWSYFRNGYEPIVDGGRDAAIVGIRSYNANWTWGRFVPLYKSGESKFFVEYYVILPDKQDGGPGIAGFTFKSSVSGLCSRAAFKKRIEAQINQHLLDFVAERLAESGKAQAAVNEKPDM